uniref:Uncharacterized protein n=1 Tax=Panagrolaimus sp. PS1159 TaxID=55785 RepID=A0AC35G7K7_9BILA
MINSRESNSSSATSPSLSSDLSPLNENKICLYQEAQNFCDKTTVHGPKRIFYGNGIFRFTWLIIVICSTAFLIWQTILLIQDYFTKPTGTQVSIIFAENGQHFPYVTICNYNTIKKSYIKDLGKCLRMELETAAGEEKWLKKQYESGINNGLQVIADVRQDEEMDYFEINDEISDILPDSIPLSQYEKGFRFYVHSDSTVPYLATDGITVSPGSRIYSSIDLTEYQFLEEDDWGNCTDTWPKNLHKNTTYSAPKCKAFCNAEFFYNKCNCTPFIYNLDKSWPVCTAMDVYKCIKGMNVTQNQKGYARSYKQQVICQECAPECKQWVFNHMNSYGAAFSKNSLIWLENKSSNWTADYIKNNFVSSIGGNMGLCLGISFVSITELSVWIFKSIIALLSTQRKEHIVKRWKKEKAENAAIKKACKMAEEKTSMQFYQEKNDIVFGTISTVEKL